MTASPNSGRTDPQALLDVLRALAWDHGLRDALAGAAAPSRRPCPDADAIRAAWQDGYRAGYREAALTELYIG